MFTYSHHQYQGPHLNLSHYNYPYKNWRYPDSRDTLFVTLLSNDLQMPPFAAVCSKYFANTKSLFLNSSKNGVYTVPSAAICSILPHFAFAINIWQSVCRGTRKALVSYFKILLICVSLPCFAAICQVCSCRWDC